MASDKPISATQLDRFHGFLAAEQEADESELAMPVTHVFKQGALLIDISDGVSDTLFLASGRRGGRVALRRASAEAGTH